MINIKKIIQDEFKKILMERESFDIPGGLTKPQLPVKRNIEPSINKQIVNPSINKQNVKPAVRKEPIKKIQQPVQSVNKSNINKKSSIPMKKIEYQIFNIKMRINKLGINTLTSRFNQSLKDFDLNISKNSKDSNKINNYLLPVTGNLEALKNALESLNGEFEKLGKLIDKKIND